MTLGFDLFWSFRSPYSYLATPRLRRIVQEFDVACRVRPVYPIAVRIPGFFEKVDPLWPRYLIRDVVRVAEMEGLTIAWPRPDPIVQDPATLKVADDQPLIRRLTRLGVAAVEAGRGLEFLDEASRLIWGGAEGWDQGDHLAQAAARAGLDLAALDRVASAEADRIEAVIAANEADQRKAGHWGVPLMSFEGEPFFGQDRIDALLWRMRQRGLTPRTGA